MLYHITNNDPQRCYLFKGASGHSYSIGPNQTASDVPQEDIQCVAFRRIAHSFTVAIQGLQNPDESGDTVLGDPETIEKVILDDAPESEQCKAIKDDGEQCSFKAKYDGYCTIHAKKHGLLEAAQGEE